MRPTLEILEDRSAPAGIPLPGVAVLALDVAYMNQQAQGQGYTQAQIAEANAAILFLVGPQFAQLSGTWQLQNPFAPGAANPFLAGA